MSDLTLRVLDVLVPAGAVLIVAAIYFAAAFLQKKSDAIENDDIRKIVKDVVDNAKVAATEAVQATAQEYVNDLKAARANGKLTDEEAAKARARAFKHFTDIMGHFALQQFESVVGDVGAWFQSYVEVAVDNLKARPSDG